MTLIENRINSRLSREIVELLQSRGWTNARVARTLRISRAYADRAAAGEKSFLPQHVRTLARSLRTDVHTLLFEAMEPAALKSKDRGMWLSMRRLMESTAQFQALLRAKPAKKRRGRVKAA